MAISKTIEIHECEFCKKIYKRKYNAEYHEKLCNKNPINQVACYGCDNLCKQDHVEEMEYHNRTFSLLFCKAKKEFMHQPQSVIRRNIVTDSELMPIQCDLFKQLEYF